MPFLLMALASLLVFNTSCKKDDALVVDVSFTADKSTVASGEKVTFSIGHGADLSSIYTGDAGHDFLKSRINLVELQSYTEEQLRSNIFGERIENLQEFLVSIPTLDAIPSDYSFDGDMALYDGKLVPWDFSDVTNSRYIQLTLNGSTPQTLSFRPNNAVIPTMLDYNNNKLRQLGALRNVANNTFAPFASFPSGFSASSSSNGITTKFGIQVIIDGQVSAVRYYTVPVRELLDNLNFNIDGLINDFQASFPDVDMTKGIEEIRWIFNADDPEATDDDGTLLAYAGNVYIQEMRIGSADNVVKGFDRGVSIPYVHEGTAQTIEHTYNAAGTYTVTLVSSFIGRKKYSDDGYRTNRPDEISAEEYDIKRTFKEITITVTE